MKTGRFLKHTNIPSIYSKMPIVLNMYMYTHTHTHKREGKMQMDVRKYSFAFCECSVINILPL